MCYIEQVHGNDSYLAFGGDEGYIKLYHCLKQRDHLNIKHSTGIKPQEINSRRLESQLKLHYDVG